MPLFEMLLFWTIIEGSNVKPSRPLNTHTLCLPLAQELFENLLLFILSKMLNIGIFLTKGRNSKKCSFLGSIVLRGGTWILGNGTR